MLVDARFGIGCLVWQDGGRYEGQWLRDQASGLGCEFLAEGTYRGEFQGDLREGVGIFTDTSGTVCTLAPPAHKPPARFPLGLLGWVID